MSLSLAEFFCISNLTFSCAKLFRHVLLEMRYNHTGNHLSILLIIIILTSRQCVIGPWYYWKCSPSIQIGCSLWQSDTNFSNGVCTVFDIQSTRARDYISMSSLLYKGGYIQLSLRYTDHKNGISVWKKLLCYLQGSQTHWYYTFCVVEMSAGVSLLTKRVLT